ncbi:MAG: hypothetical protein RMY33_001060 [Nostoc sp. DedQUE03]|nr:hypothetical protein [Nostoc sp. DedQUE03]MDZ8043580.1 hypothetical protein [Nostoc sp. DedQUE02]
MTSAVDLLRQTDRYLAPTDVAERINCCQLHLPFCSVGELLLSGLLAMLAALFSAKNPPHS